MFASVCPRAAIVELLPGTRYPGRTRSWHQKNCTLFILSFSLFSCSGEFATKANDKSLSLRMVVQTTAPFFVVPSCIPKIETAKL